MRFERLALKRSGPCLPQHHNSATVNKQGSIATCSTTGACVKPLLLAQLAKSLFNPQPARGVVPSAGNIHQQKSTRNDRNPKHNLKILHFYTGKSKTRFD